MIIVRNGKAYNKTIDEGFVDFMNNLDVDKLDSIISKDYVEQDISNDIGYVYCPYIPFVVPSEYITKKSDGIPFSDVKKKAFENSWVYNSYLNEKSKEAQKIQESATKEDLNNKRACEMAAAIVEDILSEAETECSLSDIFQDAEVTDEVAFKLYDEIDNVMERLDSTGSTDEAIQYIDHQINKLQNTLQSLMHSTNGKNPNWFVYHLSTLCLESYLLLSKLDIRQEEALSDLNETRKRLTATAGLNGKFLSLYKSPTFSFDKDVFENNVGFLETIFNKKPKGKLIIVEGPDCVGKSIEVDKIKSSYLSENRKVTVEHLTWSPAIQRVIKPYMISTIQNAIDKVKAGEIVILDRSFISELVYTNVYRRENLDISASIYDDCCKLIINNLSKSEYGVYIVLSDSIDKWAHNYDIIQNRRSELYKFDSKMEAVYNYFEQMGDIESIKSYGFEFNYIIKDFKLR